MLASINVANQQWAQLLLVGWVTALCLFVCNAESSKTIKGTDFKSDITAHKDSLGMSP